MVKSLILSLLLIATSSLAQASGNELCPFMDKGGNLFSGNGTLTRGNVINHGSSGVTTGTASSTNSSGRARAGTF